MSDEQRTLAGYKSKVHEQEDFANPNEGKPLLDDVTEYVFRLTEFPRVKTMDQVKEKRDGTKQTVKVDKAICIFEEETTKNVVTAFFRVDSLNFSEDESFESGVVRFFKKIKTPLIEGVPPEWEQYFVVGMRFRGRVIVKKGEDKKPNGAYYLDVPTCRPILESDKHPEAIASSGAPSLIDALFLAKGAKDGNEAYHKLTTAGASTALIQVFISASKAGQVTYPI